MKITIIDSIMSKVDRPDLLRPYFSFKKEFWKKGIYKRERMKYDFFLIDKKGNFLTGFIPRITKHCQDNNIDLVIEGQLEKIKPGKILLQGLTLRDDQQRLIETALSRGRGILKSPTGSGKTIIACGIMSAYKKYRVLFLCHTISLLKQTKEEIERFGLGPVSIVGSGSKDLSGKIVVSTMQSLIKIPIEDYCDKFDVVFIDESHHCRDFNNTYAKLLKCLLAPVKLGLTATIPTDKESVLAMEGLLGPVIDELTLEEGMRLEILAKPTVKLIKVPPNEATRDLRKYHDIYEAGIVTFRKRNRLIIEEAKKLSDEGKSSLIYVTQIEHGERLVGIADLLGLPVTFIKGDVDAETREQLRHDLHNKKILTVIATVVWKEGINVRSLDCIMIAGGGKSELALLQTVGRGFRRDVNKKEILIIDFLDSSRYLAEHAIERLGVYIENEWI